MAAHANADIDVTDREVYQQYVAQMKATRACGHQRHSPPCRDIEPPRGAEHLSNVISQSDD
jgi:hypothetical protein